MDVSVLFTVPLITAFAALIVSTVTDIRVREVPDWVSYSLISLGLLYGLVATIINRDWSLAYSILGLAVGYAVGAVLYYTGQWGGGDAKLLMGLGAVIALPWSWFSSFSTDVSVLFSGALWSSAPLFLRFLGLTIITGAIYGIGWMIYLIVRNYREFRQLFAKKLASMHVYRIIVWIACAIGLLLAFFAPLVFAARLLIVVLVALVFLSFYLMIAIKIAEQKFMLKTIPASKLTEGDWVVGGVQIGKEWIIPADNIGATKEQIAVLTKRAPHKDVIVKEGIPFVPSFLAAFIIALL